MYKHVQKLPSRSHYGTDIFSPIIQNSNVYLHRLSYPSLFGISPTKKMTVLLLTVMWHTAHLNLSSCRLMAA